MQRRQSAWTYIVLAGLGGCADKEPARVTFTQPPVIFDMRPVALNASVVNKSGEAVPGIPITYSVAPTGVATISPDGLLTCLESGDASVLVAGGGQSATATVSCQFVASIEALPEVRVILGKGPVELMARALDRQGSALKVPLVLTATNPAIARISGNMVEGVSTGSTDIRISAGSATAVTHVNVLEQVASQPLAIEDGNTQTWALQKGHYELDIKVEAADHSRYGVTVSWVGASCPPAAESQEHHIVCVVPETASLTVSNPSLMGLGPSAIGFINLYRQ